MSKFIIIFIIVILSFPGCASTRAIESARNTIAGLEQLNTEQESRNIELEKLLESEREGNKELEKLLLGLREENNQYFESERNRVAEERKIIDRLSGIFSSESEIIEKLIRGYREIRDYFESLEILE
ncbi:hypothetical protein KAR91_62900 [Candidatus Pacearchaeota archaeon]|nr:hypothetical protein [Candidatus Pacearchaeota archaeon]